MAQLRRGWTTRAAEARQANALWTSYDAKAVSFPGKGNERPCVYFIERLSSMASLRAKSALLTAEMTTRWVQSEIEDPEIALNDQMTIATPDRLY